MCTNSYSSTTRDYIKNLEMLQITSPNNPFFVLETVGRPFIKEDILKISDDFFEFETDFNPKVD